MNIQIKNIRETNCSCDAIILPVTEGEAGLYDSLGSMTSKLIKRIFARGFRGKQNEVILITAPEDIKAENIMLAGLGRRGEVTSEKIRQAGGMAATSLRNMGMKRIALSTAILTSLKQSPHDFIEGLLLRLYTFKKYRTGNDDKVIENLIVLSVDSQHLRDELQWIQTVTDSVSFAKDLINTPANDMTPSHLATAALSLKVRNLTIKVLERKVAQKLGMGAYLSVAKGSGEPLKFISLEYKGSKGAPLVLIGKSITFDSGGISLKPADGMEKMKYDMAGGAAVLGIIKAVSELRMPLNLIGILPATENLPGGSASRPGDIVRAITGKTIEIINTDAEGRMTLADAIGYSKRFNPAGIIDIATLTGACSIALGNEAIAMMGNDRKMMDRLKQSADSVHERVWEMPLFEEYKEYLKSDTADVKNSGGKNGSLVTAGFFLSEFAGGTPWVHLDIAGTAWTDKDKPYIPKGPTGIGVRLILDYIRNLVITAG
jgi:leucyl aminopeptidase